MRPQQQSIMTAGRLKAEIESDRTCVVYEPKTGAIVHVHRMVTMKGGYVRSDADAHVRALEVAGASVKGRDCKKMQTLMVDSDRLVPHAAFKVDHKKRALVEVKRRKVPKL
jgi:hypothetical protein